MKLSLRIILTLFLSIYALSNLQAQLPAIAPDFTITDTDGTSHRLYTYLNQGKTVVIHFATTDCGACWGFHETQTMNTAQAAYGSGGTGDMVFLLLEADSISGLSELQGEGLYTQGDWLTDTTYPVIDDAEAVAAEYGISDFPAIIAVCADTTISDLYTQGYPSSQDMYIAHQGCLPTTSENDLTIIDISQDRFCGTLQPEVLVMNTGTSPVDTATFEISNGMQMDTVEWIGSLASGANTTLTLDTEIIDATSVEVTVLDVNSIQDNSSFTKNIEQVEQQFAQRITISITTDGFGCETQWFLRNGSGSVVATGGNIDATAGKRAIEYEPNTGECSDRGYDNNTNYTLSYPSNDTLVLASGCYEFQIVDDWGDGLCCQHGGGGYRITDQDGNTLAEGGDFGAEERILFDFKSDVDTTTSITDIINNNTFNIFPNPVQDKLYMTFDLNEVSDIRVSLYNTMGQQVKHLPSKTYTTGQNNIQMDVQDLPSGIYIATIQADEGNISRKISIARP